MKMILPNIVERKPLRIFLMLLLLTVSIGLFNTPKAHAAATLSHLSDSLSSMTQGVGSTHTIVFTASTATAMTQITLTASTAWGSQPTSSWSVTDTTASTAMTSLSVTATSATIFTLSFSSYTPSAVNHVFTITTPAITNWASAGTYTETIGLNNTTAETGSNAVLILATAGANQLSLNATVGPSISFSVSGGPLSMPSGGGNLTLANATANKSSQATIQITTNAANGATITVQDSNGNSTQGELDTSPVTHAIQSVGAGTAAALSTAAEGYGMGCPTVATGTVSTTYASSYVNAYVGNLNTAPQTLWSDPASFGTTVTLSPYFNVNVTGATPAGTYVDTITYIATATF